MRWDDLFADLDAQAAALDVAERAAEVEERARIEFAAVGLLDRLQAAIGTPLRLQLSGGLAIDGVMVRAGADWVLCDEGAGREALVAMAAIRVIHGLGRHASPPGSGGAVLARLTLRSALRGVARDRSAVRLNLMGGDVLDATIDRVGADFVEAARHPAGEARRRGDVRDVVVVPLRGLAAVRRTSA